MEIVINGCYGGYYVPQEVEEAVNEEWEPGLPYFTRTHPALIDLVKAHPGGELKVVAIPVYATDYDILEYDGLETVVYVVDGKLNFIS